MVRSEPNVVSVLQGAGDGSFAAVRNFLVGSGPEAVAMET